MARFAFEPAALEGLTVVQRQIQGDERGFLSRFFCGAEFAAAGLSPHIAQINHTLTRLRGTVRGMHFQHPPHAEAKLVSCLRGSIFDVAVDLRAGSPTFLRWHGVVLSAENRRSLYIPQGFAHGFQALEDDCELIYLHSAPYQPGAEGALHSADPALAISWPLPVACLSERDRAHPFIDDHYRGLPLS
jgi:dTDP-4-dehydrorhamnose 3,5-epimerase